MAGTDQNKWHFSLYFSKKAKNNGQLTHLIYKFYYICLQIVSASVEKGINNHEKALTQQTNTLKPNW